MKEETIKALYQSYCGTEPESITPLTPTGSNRQYFRLQGSRSLIGVHSTSIQENEAFFYMARHFRSKGIPVPEVYTIADDRMSYLQEDLGNLSLFDAIAEGRQTGHFGPEEIELLKRSITLLPRIQFEGDQGMDYSHCFPTATFDRRSVLWDLNYFKYCFLKATGIEIQENLLEDDFERFADILLQVPADSFLYRDFQSRNILIQNGQPWFIDFQGGRKGPLYYDITSFLWQAKANFPEALRQELINDYLQALLPYRQIDSTVFRSTLRHFILFRTLQVLGAYGFRGYFEQKKHFLESIPYAIRNLAHLLEEPDESYPYLTSILQQICVLPQFASVLNRRKLTVSVESFSYKKGIPQDRSNNGGGFVFDCRAIHNPGRYEAYKQLTGRDEPVMRFLEKDGEIITFLQHVEALVDASVKRYLQRGFTHLQVCFGCTGGRHRSVYAAQHLAEHLHRNFGIRVELTHREQQIQQTFEAW